MARNLFESVDDESDAVHSRLTAIRQFDVASVTVTGEGLNLAPVGRAATFTIQSRDIETTDVNVKVTGQRQFFSSPYWAVYTPVVRVSCIPIASRGYNYGSLHTANDDGIQSESGLFDTAQRTEDSAMQSFVSWTQIFFRVSALPLGKQVGHVDVFITYCFYSRLC